MRVLNGCICLNLTECKRMGYFMPNSVVEGVMTWAQGGNIIASIHFLTDTVNHVCKIEGITADGGHITQQVRLRWRTSNLNPRGVVCHKKGGYYYFVCPITGRSCRKLYLINGLFVSRYAFKHKYEC